MSVQIRKSCVRRANCCTGYVQADGTAVWHPDPGHEGCAVGDAAPPRGYAVFGVLMALFALVASC